ncbi:hypothetical protein BAAA27672_05915 [Bifidobacterium animalis subsp. animalis ATCC 27672]|nr:hypothetical protein BAAA27672_05915 [Bifidobacterium animalis subsp. animalis ATCC 27672]
MSITLNFFFVKNKIKSIANVFERYFLSIFQIPIIK